MNYKETQWLRWEPSIMVDGRRETLEEFRIRMSHKYADWGLYNSLSLYRASGEIIEAFEKGHRCVFSHEDRHGRKLVGYVGIGRDLPARFILLSEAKVAGGRALPDDVRVIRILKNEKDKIWER